MPVYVLSVGSNIEPEKHTQDMLAVMASEQHLLHVSRWIRTQPDGYKEQPDFLNGAIVVESPLRPDEFKQYCRSLEERSGRLRNQRRDGPRTLDLDIIACDGCVIHSDYPQKSYVRDPVDEVCAMAGIILETDTN